MKLLNASLIIASSACLALAGCHRGGHRAPSDGAAATAAPVLRHGNTPLHVAIANGEFGEVKSLLQSDADVNAVNDRGETPLMVAANVGSAPVVDLLLAKGASVDVKSHFGKTALTFACDHQSVAIVRRLVAAGASTAVIDSRGRGLDVYAKGNPEILDALHGSPGLVTSHATPTASPTSMP